MTTMRAPWGCSLSAAGLELDLRQMTEWRGGGERHSRARCARRSGGEAKDHCVVRIATVLRTMTAHDMLICLDITCTNPI